MTAKKLKKSYKDFKKKVNKQKKNEIFQEISKKNQYLLKKRK